MSAIRRDTYVFITLSPDGGTRSFHAFTLTSKKGNVRVRCSCFFFNEFCFFLLFLPPPPLPFACSVAQRGYTWKVEMIKKKKKKKKKAGSQSKQVLTVTPASVDSHMKLREQNILMFGCTNDYWHKLKIQGVYEVRRVWKEQLNAQNVINCLLCWRLVLIKLHKFQASCF